MNNKILKMMLTYGFVLLFLVSSFAPISISQTKPIEIESIYEKNDFDSYHISEISNYDLKQTDTFDSEPTVSLESSAIAIKKESASTVNTGPMDSAWPMYCHDARHTSRSPYSTVDTWEKVWRFETKGWADSSPAIDSDGTIYIGSWYFYAVYPNGTLKWKYSGGLDSSCPAIDENGIIYIGTDGALCAIYPDGSTKWTYPASGIESSPAIGNDGTIYFADTDNWNIKALNRDGTLKWSYPTNHVIYSSPAIGIDGTIYCGSHDGNVYALYPNNGTLRWKYDTGSWVHGSPTIGDDGTVYIGADNGYLYAFYPNNGTVKWMQNIGAVYGSPALDKDGTIYVGVWEKTFYAIYPNGTIKWSFNTGGGKVWGSSPALSDDDTIYFGTCDLEWTGGIEIIALYTDGTVKWRKGLDTVFSSPAIGEDGTVYIGSCGEPGVGFLNAFGRGDLEADANGPYYGLINEPVHFTGYSKGGYSPHTFHWDFGDDETSDEQNPTHIYTDPRNYTVTLTVTDDEGNVSVDTTWAWIQESNDPPNKPSITGPTRGKVGESYDYTFVSIDPDDNDAWYYIDWGDDQVEEWIGPYDSGEEVIVSHTWDEQGEYTIRAKARDIFEDESDWAYLEVKMPVNQQSSDSLFIRFLERFPNAFPILRNILGS